MYLEFHVSSHSADPPKQTCWVGIRAVLKDKVHDLCTVQQYAPLLCCFMYTKCDAHLNIYRMVSFCSNWQTSVSAHTHTNMHVHAHMHPHTECIVAGFAVPLSGDLFIHECLIDIYFQRKNVSFHNSAASLTMWGGWPGGENSIHLQISIIYRPPCSNANFCFSKVFVCVCVFGKYFCLDSTRHDAR